MIYINVTVHRRLQIYRRDAETQRQKHTLTPASLRFNSLTLVNGYQKIIPHVVALNSPPLKNLQ
jgi:hypothetical protein